MTHGHRQRAVGAGRGGQPVVGELRVVGVVGRHHDDLLAAIARLGHEVRVRGAGDRQVGAPHQQVGGVPPVAGLRHVGLVAEHLRRGDRQVGVPVVERKDRAADQRQEAGAGGVRHLRHRRDRREADDPVRPVRLDRVHVSGRHQLRDLRPRRPHEPALAPRALVLRGAFRVTGDVRPRRHRVAETLPRLAPHPQQRRPHIRVPHPRRGVGVPGERRAARAAARLVLRGVRARRRVIRLLRLPRDDAVLDVHLPRARARAVHPVGRADLLVVPPALPVEPLRLAPVAAVQLAVVRRRPARGEELCAPQQRLDRLAAGKQRRQRLRHATTSPRRRRPST